MGKAQSKHEESKLDESEHDESQVEQSKLEQSKHDEFELDESKLDESKHDGFKRDESKHDESKLDESNESKVDESIDDELEEVKRVLQEEGVSAAQELLRNKLKNWNDVKVKIGVTGDSGVGKSRFINAIRGLHDEDEGAAEIDVVEKTSEPTFYSYPDHPNIKLVDLPGIGTPSFPDLDTYCEKVEFETYDTFLILTATRFMQHDLELADKIKTMGKSFFLIRTKIDLDEFNESKSKRHPDIEAMLKRIRDDCYKNVEAFGIDEEKIFLISNYHTDLWDFSRLVQAILKQLPDNQKEALTLSLRILSEDILKKKVEALRSQVWRISILFYAALPLDLVALPINVICNYVGALKHFIHETKNGRFYIPFFSKPVVSGEDSDPLEMTAPVGCASVPIALAIVGKKAEFFRSQLGLPEENSDEFNLLKPEYQERMKQFYQKDEESVLKKTLEILVKPLYRNSVHPRATAVNSLHYLLDEMEALSLEILKETAGGN